MGGAGRAGATVRFAPLRTVLRTRLVSFLDASGFAIFETKRTLRSYSSSSDSAPAAVVAPAGALSSSSTAAAGAASAFLTLPMLPVV